MMIYNFVWNLILVANLVAFISQRQSGVEYWAPIQYKDVVLPV